MLNRNLLFLIGAVILGVIAAFMAYQHIQDRAERAAAEAAARIQTYRETQVVVAQRDLDPGDRLYRQDMVLRSVPIDFVPADAVTYEEFEGYVTAWRECPSGRVCR
jgi:pilus assembly protein CpaB